MDGKEVQEQLRSGGWSVILGREIDHAEYLRAAAAVALSIASLEPGPFLAYMEDFMRRQARAILRRLRGVPERELRKWIAQSLRSNQVISYRQLAIQAGFVSYNHRQGVVPLLNTHQAFIRYMFN